MLSFLRFHVLEQRGNFKDQTLKLYGGNDFEEMLNRCEEAGVDQIMIITLSHDETMKAVEFAKKDPERFQVAAGIFPEDVKDLTDEMWEEFKANKCLQLVLSIFVVVFLASFISAPVNAYYPKLANYSEIAQNAILLFTTIIPAILLIVVGYLIYKYPLTDERLDEINKEIEARHRETKSNK